MRIDCGIHPYEIGRYTLTELAALRDELDRRDRERREEVERWHANAS